MANAVPNEFKSLTLAAALAAATDLRIALLVGHTPNPDTDEYWSDVVGHEISATGYTTLGQSLGSPAVTKDEPNDRAYLDATDVTWTGFTGTANCAVIYDKTAGATSTWRIWGVIDFGSDKTASGGDFKITFAAPGSGGVLYLS